MQLVGVGGLKINILLYVCSQHNNIRPTKKKGGGSVPLPQVKVGLEGEGLSVPHP